MRLSPLTGKAVMGIGSTAISINGVVPPALIGGLGGGWGWLDDDTLGGQFDSGGGNFLAQYVVSTDTLSVLDPTPSGVTDAAQAFAAGNSKWAAFLSGGALKGVRSNILARLPQAGLGDVDEDGRLVVVQLASADNGIVSYASSGAKLATIAVQTFSGIRAKSGVITNRNTTGEWHIRSIVTGVLQPFAPRTDEVVAGMVPIEISGVLYVVELTATKLTIRPAMSSNGFVLATSPNLFGPDAVSLSAGTVRVGWSVTTGEAPTDLRLIDLTISNATNSTGTTSGGSLVITPQSALSGAAFPTGAVEGQTSVISLQTVQHQPLIQPNSGNRIDQVWLSALQRGMNAAGAGPNVSGASGVLQPPNGGTGTTTGLTVLNGQNLIPLSVPYPALAPDAVARVYAIASLRI